MPCLGIIGSKYGRPFTEIFCYFSPVKPNQIDKVDLCSTRCEYKHRPQLTAERLNRTQNIARIRSDSSINSCGVQQKLLNIL